MKCEELLKILFESTGLKGKIAHQEIIPARKGFYRKYDNILPEEIKNILELSGITKLYSHQLKSYNLIKQGKNVVMNSSSASGKSLCFLIPLFEELLSTYSSTGLLVFSSKTAARDLLGKVEKFRKIDERLPEFSLFDGDVPAASRRNIRDNARVILTNPDMLHNTILPAHVHWSRFLRNVRYVVIDDVHLFRGIFGTQCSHVFRRLNRICDYYGAEIQYVMSSSTIGNPREHAEKLIGQKAEPIFGDGAPKARKYFIFWNPFFGNNDFQPEISSNSEAEKIFSAYVVRGIKSVLFTKSWISTELVCRHAKKSLEKRIPGRAKEITVFRGGYLPEKRRQIEDEFFHGKLLGICTTNALETGIDVKDLQVCIIVGYPGTISVTWQQAGRTGRHGEDSIVILIAHNTPVNQYLMRNPEYFFSKEFEDVLINPENLYVLSGQLQCYLHELPLSEREAGAINRDADVLLRILEEEGRVKKIKGTYYYTGRIVPSKFVSLRNITGSSFTVMERETERIIGSIDEISAYPVLHPGAVYFYGDDTYVVEELDIDKKMAFVRKDNVSYYTNPLGGRGVGKIDSIERSKKIKETKVSFGEVTAHFTTYAFQKIDIWTGHVIDQTELDLPPQVLKTMAYWIEPDDNLIGGLLEKGINPEYACRGLGHALMIMTSFYAQCFVLDVRDSYGWECPDTVSMYAIFIFDNYQGGLGYSEYGYLKIEELLDKTSEMIESCPCDKGCPSCVGYHLRPFIRFDPQKAEGSIPNKANTLLFLEGLLGKKEIRRTKNPVKLEIQGDKKSRDLPETVRAELRKKLLKNKFH